jgi:hypothetical protein
MPTPAFHFAANLAAVTAQDLGNLRKHLIGFQEAVDLISFL